LEAISMTTATLEIGEPLTRQEWLAWRQTGIGASDSPKILGLSKYGTPLDVYLDKIGEGEEFSGNNATRLGLAAEPMLATLYEQQTGRTFLDTQKCVTHETIPYLRATLDGVTTCGRNVQLKTTGGDDTDEYGEEGTDEMPPHVLCQVHHEMLVADLQITDVPVLLGRRVLQFKIYTVKRDPEWDAVILEAAREFWQCVVMRKPPKAIIPLDNRNLARLYKPSGAEIILPDGVSAEALRREELRAQIKALEAECDIITGHLREQMGEASTGILSDGRVLKRRIAHIAERTQTIKAYTTDSLQIAKGKK
jgi:putative phage-type endonuclease